MADEISKSFECLPIDQLICAPIVAVAQSQAELCSVYLNTLFSLAYKGNDRTKINTIDFNLQRLVVDDSGDAKTQDVKVSAPLLSLVPVPAFTMDEATVRFTMEVKEINKKTDKSHAEAETEVGYGSWGFHASIKGKVSADSSHTRESDHSAKYEIYARASQQPPAEGMAKLTSIFASVIEPITA